MQDVTPKVDTGAMPPVTTVPCNHPDQTVGCVPGGQADATQAGPCDTCHHVASLQQMEAAALVQPHNPVVAVQPDASEVLAYTGVDAAPLAASGLLIAVVGAVMVRVTRARVSRGR